MRSVRRWSWDKELNDSRYAREGPGRFGLNQRSLSTQRVEACRAKKKNQYAQKNENRKTPSFSVKQKQIPSVVLSREAKSTVCDVQLLQNRLKKEEGTTTTKNNKAHTTRKRKNRPEAGGFRGGTKESVLTWEKEMTLFGPEFTKRCKTISSKVGAQS